MAAFRSSSSSLRTPRGGASSSSQNNKPVLFFTWQGLVLLMVVFRVFFFMDYSSYTTVSTDHNESQEDNNNNSNNAAAMVAAAASDNKCSCHNDATAKCCERRVFYGHKFGYVLIKKLFNDTSTRYGGPITLGDMTRPDPFPDSPHYQDHHADITDYRHVVVTRQIFSALVSGYLYHKSGRECWLDMYGVPWKKPRRFGNGWMKRQSLRGFEITKNLQTQPVPPPMNGRSLCEYLANETEPDGMRVFMDIIGRQWYSNYVPYYENVQKQKQRNGNDKTMFVCFENMSDPNQQETVFEDMQNYLFPGGQRPQKKEVAAPRALLEEEKAVAAPKQDENKKENYKGGHATNPDPQLRARLAALAKQYDNEIFDGFYDKFDETYPCGRTTA